MCGTTSKGCVGDVRPNVDHVLGTSTCIADAAEPFCCGNATLRSLTDILFLEGRRA
jgi:hypothetical protein